MGVQAVSETNGTDWAVRLFERSVLKQRKYGEITGLLGSTEGLHCLDIGGDNGVISLLLRRRGGSWKSADLDEPSILAIRELVSSEVYQIDGGRAPFGDNEFDRVVIVDFLEHVDDDHGFVSELHRILKPGGILIVNVPRATDGLLRRFRLALGQTDEGHGHVRPGYTVESLKRLFGDRFTVESHVTYSRFFSELIDAVIVYFVSRLKGGHGGSKKGLIVTGQDLRGHRTRFRLYSALYPVFWLVSKLDAVLFFSRGYMLLAKARVNKPSALLQQ